MAYSILVVDEHPVVVAQFVLPLKRAGYDVTGATTFEAAKYELERRPPHLLIAAERLGLFNGLHLVLCARHEHPEMTAILTAPSRDPILEAEATNCGAACVPTPQNGAELLALVCAAFASRPM
jgi:DNA-binding response OmpR family regulator